MAAIASGLHRAVRAPTRRRRPFPRVGFVEGWYLDPDLRRQGWGRRLISAAEAWTAARGLTELASDAELANAVGIAAHQAAGFRETFRLVHFLKPVKR
ncbi:GNAT family N-acetyltransferase [Lacunisphaera limnophila]|uniref:GNAT family N-acetyltransferase n=1 Tax=Lacunisphaera limnophila TaxID=1838286 RepID=UPI0009F1C8A2